MFLAAHGASGLYGSFPPNDRLHKIQDTLAKLETHRILCPNSLCCVEATNSSASENQGIRGFLTGSLSPMKALNALVGQIMKVAKGKANPQQVNDLLKKKLG